MGFEDTGFVMFPHNEEMRELDTGKTFVYLVAIECENTKVFSTVTLGNDGVFCGSDVLSTTKISTENIPLEKTIEIVTFNPKEKGPTHLDLSQDRRLVSSVLLGWSELTYYSNGTQPWICGYNELTEHGKRLYFSLKKLHNDKEIKILTFNNIK